MKVLVVVNSLKTGGAERLIVEMLSRYKESNDEIDLDLALLDDGNYQFKKQLRQLNPKCNIIDLGRISVYNPWNVFRIGKVLHKYDLVHVHLFPSLYWVSIAKVLFRAKTKLIYTEHSTTNKRRWVVFRGIERIIYGKYDRIVCISSEVRSILRRHLNFDYRKFSVIPNGVALNRTKSLAPANRMQYASPDQFILIQVARFSIKKDQKTLIRAIGHTKSNIVLLLVGDGRYRRRCEKLAAKLKVEDRVKFLGECDNVTALIDISDIVILSSKYEGLSLSGLEAMAAGKPIIASNVPGLTLLIKGAGIFFPLGDYEALAEEIDALVSNKALREECGTLGLQRANDFSIEKMIHSSIELYKSL